MRKKIVYTEGPSDITWDSMKVIDPKTIGLPSPEEIAQFIKKKPKSKKITIMIDQNSLDFFRGQARLHDTKYQTMIKTVIDEYVRKATES